MKIRQATLSECSTIKTFLKNSWEDTYKNLLSPTVLSYILKEWHSAKSLEAQIKDPSILFLLAENNANIVGLSTVKIKNDTELFLGRLYVQANQQKKGIGNALLKETICYFPNHKKINTEVQEKNKPALDFYHHVGFEFTAVGKKNILNDQIKTLYLTKRINL